MNLLSVILAKNTFKKSVFLFTNEKIFTFIYKKEK